MFCKCLSGTALAWRVRLGAPRDHLIKIRKRPPAGSLLTMGAPPPPVWPSFCLTGKGGSRPGETPPSPAPHQEWALTAESAPEAARCGPQKQTQSSREGETGHGSPKARCWEAGSSGAEGGSLSLTHSEDGISASSVPSCDRAWPMPGTHSAGLLPAPRRAKVGAVGPRLPGPAEPLAASARPFLQEEQFRGVNR